MAILGPYVGILRRPGAARFTAAAFIARLPLSMVALGIILLISALRGSFAEAGLLTGAYALSAAAVNPIASRLVDRWGQWPVAGILAIVHALGLLAFTGAALAEASTLPLLLLACLAGGSQPATGAMVRARWATLIDDPEPLRTAFAWESVLDEVIFVIGPPLATILAVTFGSAVPLLVSAALVLIGTAALIAQRSTQPVHRGASERPREALAAQGGFIPVIALMVMLGSIFGSIEVVSVAVADEAGSRGMAGVILALYAFGSLLSAIVLGTRAVAHRDASRDLVLATIALVVVALPLPLVRGILPVAIATLFAGLAVSPVLIIGFSLIQQVVSPSRLTEGLTWATAGLGFGLALSAAASGAVVDAWGSPAGFLVTVGSASAGLAAIGIPYLVRRRRRGGPGAR